jgi:transcriptional regulator with XRE-family HTH domain
MNRYINYFQNGIEDVNGIENSFFEDFKRSSEEEWGELADYSELERVYISKLERGISIPSIDTIFKIAEVLKMKPYELVQVLDKNMRR